MVSCKDGTERIAFRTKEAETIAMDHLRFFEVCLYACLCRHNREVLHVGHANVLDVDLESEMTSCGIDFDSVNLLELYFCPHLF